MPKAPSPPIPVVLGILLVGVVSQYLLSYRFSPPIIRADSWNFYLVSDLDKKSLHSDGNWISVLQPGAVVRNTTTGKFTFTWEKPITLVSSAHHKGRGMELSTLEFYQNELLAFCDHGTMFSIVVNESESYVTSKGILTSGPEKSVSYKTEWATLKDDDLYVGAFGKEWVKDGVVVHEYYKEVRILSPNKNFTSIDWKHVYDGLRPHVNAVYPGYLIHEAVAWDPIEKNWLFLPRRVSTQPYDETTEEFLSGNTLFIVSEDFKTVKTVTVGPLEPEWGFTEIKVLPKPLQKHGTPTLVMGIKVHEIRAKFDSKVIIFDTKGNIHSEPQFQPIKNNLQDLKFEGMAFFPMDKQVEWLSKNKKK